MQKYLLLYLVIINVFAFILFTFDKYRSRVNARRVSEKRLHQLSFLGGFVGATFSMLLFRHKIKKLSFILVHIFIIFLWGGGVYAYNNYVDKINFLDGASTETPTITIIRTPMK